MSSIIQLQGQNRFAPKSQFPSGNANISPKYYQAPEKEPSFGAGLAGGFGKGLGESISNKLQSMLANKKRNKELDALIPGLVKGGVNKDLLDAFYESEQPIENLGQFLKIAQDYGQQQRQSLQDIINPQNVQQKQNQPQGQPQQYNQKNRQEQTQEQPENQQPQFSRINSQEQQIEQEENPDIEIAQPIEEPDPSMILNAQYASPAEQKLISKHYDALSKKSDNERKEALERTKDIREQILGNEKELPKTEARLSKMKELAQSGKLPHPFWVAATKFFGIPTSIFFNPDAEEFEKLTNDMVKDVKQVFGNKILKIDVETFLKTLPTLSNSNEGKIRVIEDLEMLIQPAKDEIDAYNKITNFGKNIPTDLHERINKATAKSKDHWSKEFASRQKESRIREIPKANVHTKDLKKDSDIARAIFKEADYDPEIAKQIAKEKGYVFE